MGYSMGARITAFLALESPGLTRSIVLGGLGIHLVDGVGLAREHRRRDGSRHRSADVTDPQGRTFRAFADKTGSDRRALAACIRGSRQEMTREQAGSIRTPALVAIGTRDLVAGSPDKLVALMPNARVAADPGPRSHDRGGRQGVQGGRAAVPSGERMTRASAPAAAMFTGASGNTLAGDVYGEEGAPVLLLHGGGQTRHAWKKTGELIARMGRVAYAVDQRGHGDSEWVKDGAYQYEDFAADARVLADTLAQRTGVRPVAVGASLGGMASLLANGGGQGEVFSALVLVDITPRIDSDGVAKIQGFMRAQIREGFGSIAEAADAVAAYLPHRPRPRSHEGLKKNLRLHPDGRWRWHWDPQIPRRQPPDRGGLRGGRAEAGRGRPRHHHPGAAGARRVLGTGGRGARQGLPQARAACALRRCRPAPATWWPATATISSQTPSRSSCLELKSPA